MFILDISLHMHIHIVGLYVFYDGYLVNCS